MTTSIALIIFFTSIRLLVEISPVKTISCYTCVDCADLSNVTQSPASCFYCYKLTVYMAYAPSRYIVKECVQGCIESSGMFGGSSLEINCCTSSLCNNALEIYSQYTWKKRFYFTIILSLLMIGFSFHKVRH